MGWRSCKNGIGVAGRQTLAVALLATTISAGLAPVGSQAYAQTSAQTSFDIPAGPLNRALAAFGRQSGAQVSYEAAIASGKTSPGIRGAATREQAVARILQGTGLVYSFADPSNVLITRPASAGRSSDGSLLLDTIDVIGESAQGPVQGFVARQSATASKTDTPLIETPQSVSVVTRDQIQQQGAQNLKQALGYTTGVASNTRTGFSGFDIIYTRGFVLDRYLNGTKLLGGASYTVPQIEPYGLERLEVFRGPASVLYGQASPGGLANAVTKRPTATPLREIELQTGNLGRLQGAFDLSGPLNADKTLLYRVTGLARTVESQVDYNKEQRLYFAPSVTWQPDDRTSLNISASIQHDPHVGLYSLVPASGTVLPNAYGRIPRSRYLGDPNYNVYKRDQQSVSYAFEHKFDEVWTVRQNFRFMHTDGEAKQLLPLGNSLSGGRILNRYSLYDANNINALTLDNQAQAKFSTGPLAHTLLLGLDYQRLSESDKLGQDLAPSIDIFAPVYYLPIARPALVSSTQQTMNQIGLYAQDQIKFDRFVLTLSGRQDWVETHTTDRLGGPRTNADDNAFTWRAGLNYVFDSGIAPYVSYSTSFQPVSGTDISGKPFKPTEGQQIEAGIKYQPVGVNATFSAAVFDLTQQNVLTPNPQNLAFLIQTGEIRSRGVELEAKASVAQGLDLVAAYTYADVEVTKSNGADLGKRPVNVPNRMASIWAFYTVQDGPLNGLGFGGGLRYVGNTPGDTANSFFVPSNTLVDMALRYDFGKQAPQLAGLNLSLNIQNLFDRRYVSECSNALNCLYGPGRTIMAGLKYRW